MRHPPLERNQALAKRILLISSICLCALIAVFILPPLLSFAAPTVSNNPQTSVVDFNQGIFYHTGLTKTTNGGGDGDGEVRLLTLGISASTWQSNGNATGLPPLLGHAAVQRNGRIYVAGGRLISGYSADVYYSDIDLTGNHNLSNWVATTPMTGTRWAHGMVAVNNFLYVIGGYQGVTAMNTVLVAPFTSNGVGPWFVTAPLPTAVAEVAAVVVNNTIYVIGGSFTNGTSRTTVYYATPDPNSGAISSWNTTTAPLPQPTQQHTAAVFNGAIYVIGGRGDNLPFYPDVYFGIPGGNGDITSWANPVTPLQNNLVLASAVTFAGQLYVAGGGINNDTSYTNTIASNLIDPNYTFSLPWVNSDVLSTPRERSVSVMSNDGWMYVIEGLDGLTLNPLHTIDFGPTVSTGSGNYAPSGTYLSPVLDLGASFTLNSLDWNATVTNTTLISLTMQYRLCSTPTVCGSWSQASSATQGTLITNTISLAAQKSQYIQYYANFNRVGQGVTPVLNKVFINYQPPPDFYITRLLPPFLSAGATPVTRTVNISVTNQGGSNFNAPIIGLSQPVVTQQSGPRGVPRTPPGGLTSPKVYTGTTNSFFWVDVYISPVTGFITPTNPAILGNCPTQSGGTNWGSVQSLAVGQTVNVAIDCWLVPNKIYTYYAQVDTCDNLNKCSATYGYVLEKNEHNNIFGPTQSPIPVGPNGIFLPKILRNSQ